MTYTKVKNRRDGGVRVDDGRLGRIVSYQGEMYLIQFGTDGPFETWHENRFENLTKDEWEEAYG